MPAQVSWGQISGRSDAGSSGQSRDATVDPQKADPDKEAVSKLIRELEDAQKTSKTQSERELREKLKELREKLGEEKFKAIIEQLKKEASYAWLAILKALFPDLFPEDVSPPAPPIDNRGGGGGGGGVNRNDFGGSEPMSNVPPSTGAGFYNYRTDTGKPGEIPSTEFGAGNIWSGFRQGPNGSCVTVSAIKAAMMRYGKNPQDIFRSVTDLGDRYDVTMKDGYNLQLTKQELQQAAQYARFEGDDPQMLTNANFLYAASAKRAMIEGNGLDDDPNVSRRSFAHAMQSLNNGEMPHEALDRLGLEGLYYQTSSNSLANGQLGVVAYSGHSMAVIGGRIELWGRRGGHPESGIAYALR
ncbi:hypothetical protein [Pseudomonas sp. CBZ-4]|uniref:hypothetical protein n=1 Tax=Pseudomonas sp. CBZ-4 TaxID=1163065 RepID=UPI0003732733|nr:hypothetical protein [Pseudomonas sp. CBZ-4]